MKLISLPGQAAKTAGESRRVALALSEGWWDQAGNAHFAGKPVNVQNVCAWRAGPHQQWLKARQEFEHTVETKNSGSAPGDSLIVRANPRIFPGDSGGFWRIPANSGHAISALN